MNLMNFRVTKLFPQRSLKQIPKCHTILKDQGNKIPSNKEGNSRLGKSLLSEKVDLTWSDFLIW